MRNINVWHDKYRGINWEINNYTIYDNKENWTFYLFLNENQFNKDLFDKELWLNPKVSTIGSKRIYYNDSESEIISGIDWHCGCTWYSKTSGFDGEKRGIKIGCDYSHLYDEDMCYSLDRVISDTKKAIDSLWELVPNIKVWCIGCGKYGNHREKRGEEYYCDKCIEKYKEPKL